MVNDTSGQVTALAQIGSFLLAMLVVFIVFSILIVISGFNPVVVYQGLIVGALGSPPALGQTFIRMGPILFCSLGLVVSFRCGMWNIGSEGQLFLGALAAAVVAIYLPGFPKVIHIILAMTAAFLVGGIWAGLCGFLKTRFNANEVITTLLSNFIAIWISFYFLKYYLQPKWAFNPSSLPILSSAELPIILKGTLLHGGILIAVICAFIVWFMMKKTSLGYSIDTVGANKIAAKYSGIKVNRIILISMFISGGLAGLAGMGEVLGVHHLLIRNISPHYGFIAIAAVFIARLNPIGAIFVSFFMGAILNGGRHIQIIMGIPTHLVDILVALFVIFMLLQPLLAKKIITAWFTNFRKTGED